LPPSTFRKIAPSHLHRTDPTICAVILAPAMYVIIIGVWPNA
jgi:hypothetical protein